MGMRIFQQAEQRSENERKKDMWNTQTWALILIAEL